MERTADEGFGMTGNQGTAASPIRPTGWKRLLPVAIVAAALAVGYLSGAHRYFSLEALARHNETLMRFVDSNFVLAAVTYVAVYVLAVAISFPGASFLTIAGGLMFGWLVAGTLTAVSATVGAAIIFLVARSAFGDFLEEKAGPRLARLRDGFRDDSFNYLLFLRLVPAFPFWLINIAPALFGMRLGPYVAATFIGILPGTFAYAYFGEGLGTAIDGSGSVVSRELLLGFAALGVAALMPVLIKRWRKGGQPRD